MALLTPFCSSFKVSNGFDRSNLTNKWRVRNSIIMRWGLTFLEAGLEAYRKSLVVRIFTL